MKTQPDWFKILTECKNNVEKSIKPHLKTLNEPQPDLGNRGSAGCTISITAAPATGSESQYHNDCNRQT